MDTVDSRSRHAVSPPEARSPFRPYIPQPLSGARAPDQRHCVRATSQLVALYRRCHPEFSYDVRNNPQRVLTKPDEGVYNGGKDNREFDYILRVNDVLGEGDGRRYLVLDTLGSGTFGQVVKCQDLESGEIVAVKIIKNHPAYARQASMEVAMLQLLHSTHSSEEMSHVLQLLGSFSYEMHLCLVFERLSINLFELIKQNNYRGIGLDLLQHFVRQILQALNVLANSNVIHCDLKPENILLESLESTDVKIIDFGSACLETQVVYSYVQSRFYRSPEVLLGMPYNSKIDVWSLGCIAGELYLGLPLFPGSSEQNMIRRIVEMLGLPPPSMLDQCQNTSKYCIMYYQGNVRCYSLKSDEQYACEQNKEVPVWKRYFQQHRLRDIILQYPHRIAPTDERRSYRECFAHFIAGLLQIDPRERWSPAEAMEHPFIAGLEYSDVEHWLPSGRSHLRRSQERAPMPLPPPVPPAPPPSASSSYAMYAPSAWQPGFPPSAGWNEDYGLAAPPPPLPPPLPLPPHYEAAAAPVSLATQLYSGAVGFPSFAPGVPYAAGPIGMPPAPPGVVISEPQAAAAEAFMAQERAPFDSADGGPPKVAQPAPDELEATHHEAGGFPAGGDGGARRNSYENDVKDESG